MSQRINTVYLQDDTINQLSEHYHKDPAFRSVTLAQFFSKEALEEVIFQISELEFEMDNKEIKHRRKISRIPSKLANILRSKAFSNIFSSITEVELDLPEIMEIQKYGHRDYKIIHDETVLDPGYDIIIDFTPEWDDSLGGYIGYTDGEGQFYTISANFGSVSIIQRDDGHHYFVKYVNHYAENLHRYLVIINTKVER